MKVKVKSTVTDAFFGFYNGKRLKRGAEFTLDKESHFSLKWMEKVEPEVIEVETPKPKAKRKTKKSK